MLANYPVEILGFRVPGVKVSAVPTVRRICARMAIVAVRAGSFRTEVLQDDAGVGGFFQTDPPPSTPGP
jgi:hypothetical protein